MKNGATILYSSSLVIILMAISSLLTTYLQSPEKTNMAELQQINAQLQELEQRISNNKTEIFLPVEMNTLMGWFYPGEPACGAIEGATKVKFDVLKPEYFAIRDGGFFELMTAENYQCNGYSPENVALARTLSDEQFVTISSSYAQDMKKFLQIDSYDARYTNQIVDFVVATDFTGAELDFEDYGGWTPEIYEQYKAFVSRLGHALHKKGKQLMIDLPPVSNDTEEAWYVLRLAELEKLPVDYLLIMGYDYQYDHGVGEPVAPLGWLAEVVKFTQSRIVNDEKIVIGLPSYGYLGDKNTGRINIITYEQAQKNSLFHQAVRDPDSAEMMAENSREILIYQDEASLQNKIDIVTNLGIDKVSIWHLGGNPLPVR